MTLTKSDLSTTLYDKGLFLQRESADFIELILEEIKQELEKGNDVKITGFGKFQVRQKKARIGRNPRTGEEHIISPRKIVTWSASQKINKKLT